MGWNNADDLYRKDESLARGLVTQELQSSSGDSIYQKYPISREGGQCEKSLEGYIAMPYCRLALGATYRLRQFRMKSMNLVHVGSTQ